MKNRTECCLSVIFLLFTMCHVVAQDKIKFGEIPESDMSMMVYANDTTAIAVTLYEDCNVRYTLRNNDFVLITEYTARVKILKTAGLDRANIVIPFYVGATRDKSETISSITGYTYNLVNGKTEQTKLSKAYIFEEKTSTNWHRIKIAFPNVKVGSVFEFKYEKTSPYYSYLDDFLFQSSMPVRYSRYQVTIPQYFTFNKRTVGYEPIDYSEKQVSLFLMLDKGDRLQCSGTQMTFVTSDLPALKDDSYVWNKQDYTAKVVFDLMSVNIPGSFYRKFSTTWADIDKQLMDNDNFGRQLRFSNLMKDELSGALNDTMTSRHKVEAILSLVKEKIQWNEKDVLYIDNVKKAIKDGIGTSAEMNAALICLLRDAGFDAYPIVLSLRSNGRIFSMFPTTKSLNYFIVGVDVGGETMYMDASYKLGAVDVISTDCMVQEARCIFKDRPGEWVDLHAFGRNGYMTNIVAKFNEDGKLSGTVQRTMSGVPCMSYYRTVNDQKSVEEYKENRERVLDVNISELEQGKPQDVSVTEKFSFENDNIVLGDDYLYINSLIFPHIEDNPFKAEIRKLPVEYPYPYELVQSVTFVIPEGYELEEVPNAEKVTLGDKQISYSYLIQPGERTIQILQRLSLMQTLYPAMEYEHLRDFWARIADKNNSQLVLRRVTQ